MNSIEQIIEALMSGGQQKVYPTDFMTGRGRAKMLGANPDAPLAKGVTPAPSPYPEDYMKQGGMRAMGANPDAPLAQAGAGIGPAIEGIIQMLTSGSPPPPPPMIPPGSNVAGVGPADLAAQGAYTGRGGADAIDPQVQEVIDAMIGNERAITPQTQPDLMRRGAEIDRFRPGMYTGTDYNPMAELTRHLPGEMPPEVPEDAGPPITLNRSIPPPAPRTPVSSQLPRAYPAHRQYPEIPGLSSDDVEGEVLEVDKGGKNHAYIGAGTGEARPGKGPRAGFPGRFPTEQPDEAEAEVAKAVEGPSDAEVPNADKSIESDILGAGESEDTYEIEKGDTLWDIAERIYGDGRMYKQLAMMNGITNPNMIVRGRVLRLPKGMSKPRARGAGRASRANV